MLFTTGAFLFVYLPITLATFFLLARLFGQGAGAIWLGIASVVFYAYWSPIYTFLLLGSIGANYFFGSLMLSRGRLSRRAILVAAVALNLGALAYFKYADFIIQTVDVLTGAQFALWHVVLPIGISFFTFTQIAYLADVYAGKVGERNPAHYLLFVTYYPHLIAGPVLHHAEMMPQFRLPEIYRPRLQNLVVGLAFLTLGMMKKVLIADSIAPIANDAFDNPRSQNIGIAHAWIGALSYTFQLYFDFSGYSDMAVGLSLLIGVQLPYNFDSPYKATSIIDFWRRWHMTLSRFLRDYLYVALGGNRLGKVRRYLNLMITMLLGGLWHGASWTFVVWGGLHGLFLVLNHGWRYLVTRWRGGDESMSRRSSWMARTLAAGLTMLCVIIAWVFFRAKSFASATQILSSMFCQPAHARMSDADWGVLPWIIVLSVVTLCLPNSQQWIDATVRLPISRLREGMRGAQLLAFVVGVEVVFIVLTALVASSRETTEFIYFNF
jgi:D-alanyl-lipoteichoic acid acyltransferase DltB (MBOAT superfamily)